MSRFLLDTSALLTLRDDEPGADLVARTLGASQRNEAQCFGCFISLMEVYYRVWKDEGQSAGRLAYEQCLALPIVWVHEDAELLEKAPEIKATRRLSLADAWVAACALQQDAALMHKDPEFEPMAIDQIRLPYKSG